MGQQEDIKHSSLITDEDIALFQAGKHYRLYQVLGSQTCSFEGQKGTFFAVWAPNAERVSLIGNFNAWNGCEHPMFSRWDGSGIWELFVPVIGH